MTLTITYIVVAALSFSIANMLLSIARPDLRTWPRPATTPWPRPLLAVIGQIFPIALLGVLLIGVLDWQSYTLTMPLRVVGALLFVVGGGWAGWGYWQLGTHRSAGFEGELIDTGAYRYGRNPQYIGTIVGLLGYAMVCNSCLTMLCALLAAINFVATPFAEEPWLREGLGSAYDDYCARVPRFLPSPRFWLGPPNEREV